MLCYFFFEAILRLPVVCHFMCMFVCVCVCEREGSSDYMGLDQCWAFFFKYLFIYLSVHLKLQHLGLSTLLQHPVNS